MMPHSPTGVCLIYCIFRSLEFADDKPITGINGHPVSVVSKNGLSAVISRVTHLDLNPDIPQALVYEKVVESFHRDRTVIPMRYGSTCREESQVVRLLDEHRAQYEGLLRELEGCVEMGIRCLLPGNNLRLVPPLSLSMPAPEPTGTDSAAAGDANRLGHSYLVSRKTCYEREERLVKENGAVIENCRMALAGLYVQCKTECSPFRNLYPPQAGESAICNPMLSLYFLVPRGSVEAFCEVFKKIQAKLLVKLLLSGPWPPYNFCLVTP